MHARERKETMPPKCRILFCTENSPLDNYAGKFDLECVPEPLKCLSLASAGIHDTVIVDLPACDPVRRGLLFELCGELKGNALTHGIKVIAILAMQDHPGLEKLHRSGIDLVFPAPEVQDGSNPAPVDLLNAIDAARQPQVLLAQLCPFINYNSSVGIASCRAQRDRLILGRQRLARLCCVEEHTSCEFFLKPALVNAL